MTWSRQPLLRRLARAAGRRPARRSPPSRCRTPSRSSVDCDSRPARASSSSPLQGSPRGARHSSATRRSARAGLGASLIVSDLPVVSCLVTPCPNATPPVRIWLRVGLALTTELPPARVPEEANQTVPQHSGHQSEPHSPPTSEPTSGSSTRCTTSTRRTRAALRPSGRSTSRPTAQQEQRYAGHHHRRQGPPVRAGPAGLHEDGRAEAAEPRPSRGQAGRAQDDEPGGRAQGRAEAARAEVRPGGRPRSPSRARPRPPPSRPRAPRSPVAKDPRPPRRPPPATSRRYTVLRGAPAAHREEHGRLADRARPRRRCARVPGQAAVGQPHRHQQPPRPRPRRQGVVHPPHRLRAGQGAQVDAGDERRLRRPSTASPPWCTPAHINLGLAIDLQKKDGTRQLLVPSHQGRRDDGLRRRSGRRTRTSSARPATTSSRSRTSGTTISPDQPRRPSAPTTRCRA